MSVVITVLNQPLDGMLGNFIERNLAQAGQTDYKRFYFLVAYAKWSGVGRLEPFFRRFRAAGGEIRGVVGIDQKNTSVQALEGLVANCDEVFVFHDESLTKTYHPKLYLFETPAKNAWASVGSSNFTAGGLYANYEVNAMYELDLTAPEANAKLAQLRSIFDVYASVNDGRCKKVDAELIEKMSGAGYIAKEEELRRTLIEGKRAQLSNRQRLFTSVPLPEPPARVLTPESDVRDEVEQIEGTNAGFWKKLSKNDVSLTSSPGQIIVPIRFTDLFPPMDEPEITNTGAEQSDVFFNVVLEMADGQLLRIDNARAIHHVPAPHHPRPNSELRFTFRSREVLERLSRDDVLEFKRSEEPSVWFIIRHVKVDSPQYASFEGSIRFQSL